MRLENSGNKLETPANAENKTAELEKNITVEKPEAVEKQDAAKNFIHDLENSEYYSSYEERLAQTPRDDAKGTWSGERGESTYTPNDANAKEAIEKCGKSGVDYKDAVPDFEPFSKETVEIEDMHANRSETFRKADNACAQKWNDQHFENKTDWNGKDVSDWRHENGYTWHECNDRQTCQLVPQEIHSQCGHLGGFAECKKKEAVL